LKPQKLAVEEDDVEMLDEQVGEDKEMEGQESKQ